MATNNIDEETWEEGVQRRRGIPEVDVQWLANNIRNVRIIDVRQPEELEGPLHAVEEAENVPLGSLKAAIGDWDRDEPTVVLCRSGGRSGRATIFMEQNGFKQVASLAGGMIDWNEAGLPTV